MGNDAWFTEWPLTEVTIFPEGEYDHWPLLIESFINDVKKKPFRFFNMWCQAESFAKFVNHVWQQQISGAKMFQIVSKLKLLKKDLQILHAS